MRTLLLGFWILDPIYGAMGRALAFFYSVIASYGVAIALLTVAVRIFLIPLTTKQVKSQQAMQRIQPELKRLQAKYKNDRVKLNEEMMKFYKENKVNPLAGCLPILMQAPLFIVLYRLILDLSHDEGPKHIPTSSKLFTSLVDSGGEMVSWGFDLAKSASSVGGFGNAFPYYVLVALTVATGYFQQRQMTSRLPKESANPQMQMVAKIFPIMIGVISLSVPAGVVVYFVVSNLWQIGQQAVTFKLYPPPALAAGGGDSSGDKVAKADRGPGKGGGGSSGSGKGGSGGGRGGGASRGGGGGAKSKKPAPGRTTPSKNQKQNQEQNQGKGKRPPPSPRPKGLPAPRKGGRGGGAGGGGGGAGGAGGSGSNGNGTSAKNSRRKDS